MASIIFVYRPDPRVGDLPGEPPSLVNMAYIRWFRMAGELAAFGHSVTMALPDGVPLRAPAGVSSRLKYVSLSAARWDEYDVVKTYMHRGFDTLSRYGGAGHPFLISKLGSVVAEQDREGIYFYGDVRKRLYETQARIAAVSQFVTVLNEQGRQLFAESHGRATNILCIPGAVDSTLPSVGPDPYPESGGVARVLFAGTVYSDAQQPEANRTLVRKLNALGQMIGSRGCRLFLMGDGDISALDGRHVTWLGAVPCHRSWDYLRHADVGIVVAAGRVHHNNESTKIYRYLRVGLPVVTESGFPNESLVSKTGHGFVVAADDLDEMANRIVTASTMQWDGQRARNYILRNHTWRHRAAVYDSLLRRRFGPANAALAPAGMKV